MLAHTVRHDLKFAFRWILLLIIAVVVFGTLYAWVHNLAEYATPIR